MSCWAYLDGKKLVDVVQAALDNNMMVDDLKAKLIAENPGHNVTFGSGNVNPIFVNVKLPIDLHNMVVVLHVIPEFIM